MRKDHCATARAPWPDLFNPLRKVPPPPPDVAAQLIPLLERLLLDARPETAAREGETGRDARER